MSDHLHDAHGNCVPDPERLKATIDLKHHIEMILRQSQPKVGVMFKKLGISPQTISDMVKHAAMSSVAVYPDIAIKIVNELFKMGITIGYAYAINDKMEESFLGKGEDDRPESIEEHLGGISDNETDDPDEVA